MTIILTWVALLLCYSGYSSAGDCKGINPEKTRFYFDPLTKSCVKFSMTIADPNPIAQTNIFGDELECTKACFPTPLSQCSLSSKFLTVTPESARRTVFTYTRTGTVDKCTPLRNFGTYDHFTDNYNAFLTENECKQQCVRPAECGTALPTPTKNQYYFDPSSKACLKFDATVTRAAGSNMFTTKAKCETACLPKPATRCAPTDDKKRVTAASAAKPVTTAAKSYFAYNGVKYRCLAKAYGGYVTLPTTLNIFANRAACVTMCPTGRAKVTKIKAACKAAELNNPSAAYFDGTSCVTFTMTVKEDTTGNAFASKAKCEKSCMKTAKPECTPANEALKVTPGSANTKAYTFTNDKNACDGTNYGGYVTIPKGKNMYASQQECTTACVRETRCSTKIPQPTNQYFFDKESLTCQKVKMQVPLIPVSNLFASAALCKTKCLPKAQARCAPTSSDKKVTKDSVRQSYYVYEKKLNRCHTHTYGGVVNIPTKANFFSTQQECVKKCVPLTTTSASTVAGQTTTPTLAPGQTTATRIPPKYVPPKAYLPDQHEDCCEWAKEGQCDSTSNFQWMRTMCSVSCGTAGATPETASSFTATIPVECLTLPTDPNAIRNQCSDKNVQCSDWAKKGECLVNYEYMLTHCQKACASCGINLENLYPNCKRGNGGFCKNNAYECCYWAAPAQNQCYFNPVHMKTACPAACGICT